MRLATGVKAQMAGFDNAVRVFRVHNFRVYTCGNSISLVGTWMQRFSVGWLAWELTHSTLWLGAVPFADLAATLVLSPTAGLLADRVDRMRLIWVTQSLAMAQAVALAVLVFTHLITIESLFCLTLALGAANAVNQPARLSLVPSLVDSASLASANAINALVFNGARFIGPAIAGPVIDRAGAGFAFAANAATYAVFMLALARVKLSQDERAAATAVTSPSRTFLDDMAAGYGYAMRHPGIGRMIMLFTVTSFSIRGFIELFPGFADTVFGRGPVGLAWLTAMIGLGALAGGLWMVRWPSVRGLTAQIVGHTLLAALAVLGFAATSNYWFALACVFVCGFAMGTTGIGAQTLIQNAVDPSMRGRVLGLYGMLFRGGVAVNALLLGWLSLFLGLRLAAALGAAICILYWAWARLRRDAMAAALETEGQGVIVE